MFRDQPVIAVVVVPPGAVPDAIPLIAEQDGVLSAEYNYLIRTFGDASSTAVAGEQP